MTITVRLPDKLEADLKARLDAEGMDVSEFVRQAIAEKLEKAAAVPAKPTAYDAWQHHFTGEGSGQSDRAERAEELVKEIIRAKRSRG